MPLYSSTASPLKNKNSQQSTLMISTISQVNSIMVARNHCTGWRRLIGSLKLQIIFHKRATKYRSLLRKMTYKDKGSYESSPPCSSTT